MRVGVARLDAYNFRMYWEPMTSAQKRYGVIILALLGIAFTTWIELFMQKRHSLIGGGLNRGFLFLLINAHIIVIVVLLYLIVQQAIRLFLERRKGVPGSVFKANLLFAFILFSVIPSLFVFFTAGKFITKSIDRWFQARFDTGLTSALRLHEHHTKTIRDEVARQGTWVVSALTHAQMVLPARLVQKGAVDFWISGHHVYVIDFKKASAWTALRDEIIAWRSFRTVNDRTTKSLRRAFWRALSNKQQHGECFDFFGSLYWTRIVGDWVVILAYRYPSAVRQELIVIQNALTDYRHLYSLRHSIFLSYVLTFALIVLLILILSVWCAFYLARGLSKPIQQLLGAVGQVREGSWDVQVPADPSSDLYLLSAGFNEMTAAVRFAHERLAQRNKEMLSILENISAAVLLINRWGTIVFCNAAAYELGLQSGKQSLLAGKRISVLDASIRYQFMEVIKEVLASSKEHVAKEVVLTLNAQQRIFMVYGRMLGNVENQKELLIVIDDLTDIVKMNKLKTWQEAARQVAHEIKNPLTPIQLATQRLQRRFNDVLKQDAIFAGCTETILSQVKIIQDLVTHFSHFASLPAPHIEVVDMYALIEEVWCLYRVSYPQISFIQEGFEKQPVLLQTDKKKIKLVLINLLDNGVRVLLQQIKQGRVPAPWKPEISICLVREDMAKMVKVIFSDNGPGIQQSVRQTLFLPYVSTEQKNMGLGLAIVHDIIRQLGGSIQLNPSRVGTQFQINLPF